MGLQKISCGGDREREREKEMEKERERKRERKITGESELLVLPGICWHLHPFPNLITPGYTLEVLDSFV